jgi:hypothetical protein
MRCNDDELEMMSQESLNKFDGIVLETVWNDSRKQ